MSDTHIHIHLGDGGEVSRSTATKAPPKKAKSDSKPSPKPSVSKTKRKPSAYNLRYAKALKQVQGKYKTKKGGWKKDGYKRAVKEAHRIARKG